MNCPPSAGRSRPRIGRGQKYLLSGLDFAQDVVAHTRIELGERVVEQKHRRRARRFRDRQQLGQPQRERQQALLAPRPEHTRIGTLELDEDVIAVRTHQRLPASELFTAVTLERSQQRRRLGRLSHRAAIAQLDLVTFPGETRIDTADLRLQSRRRPRSEEHTSELQSHSDLVCRLLLEKKKKQTQQKHTYKI